MSESAIPPRHFWRRFSAFAIDLLCATLVGALLALALSEAASERLHLSKGLISGTEHCASYDPIPAVFQDWAGNREVAEATVCTYKPYLVFPYQRRLTIQMIGEPFADSGITPIMNTSFAVNSERKLNRIMEIDGLLTQFIMLFGSALFVMRRGATPGKRLLGLKVVGQGCALCRELRRLGPFLGISFALFALPLLGGGWETVYFVSRTQMGVIYGLLAVSFAAYYVLPAIRWRGAMPYDKATGYRVTRD